MASLYISRRYSEYASTVKEVVENIEVIPVDSYLGSNNDNNTGGDTSNKLAIIICNESISDRRTQKEWLEKIANKIYSRYKQVLCLMFCLNPTKYIASYNTISPKLIVYCMRETIDDEYNKNNIHKHLPILSILQLQPTHHSLNESTSYFHWGNDNILVIDNNKYTVYHYISSNNPEPFTFDNLDEAIGTLKNYI